jgi:WD40 repeat protein
MAEWTLAVSPRNRQSVPAPEARASQSWGSLIWGSDFPANSNSFPTSPSSSTATCRYTLVVAAPRKPPLRCKREAKLTRPVADLVPVPGVRRAVAVSPDETRLASAGSNEFKLWDIDIGQEILNLPLVLPDAQVRPASVSSLAWSADGQRIAGCSGWKVW